MSLANALFSSTSGLDTTSTAISVIGDNIANVNTTGFKARRAEFSDVLGQSITSAGGYSQIGAGAKLSRVTTSFTQGTFENTGRTTDLAIEGQGFFVLDGAQGTRYSRAGIFTVDNQNTLVNPEGLRVQGFGIDPLTGTSNGQMGDVVLSNALSPPQPTTQVELAANLDAGVTEIPGGFDPLDPNATSNYSTGLTVFDSLGNEFFTTVFFTKTDAATGTWEWNATLPPADTTLPPVAGADYVVQGGGTLTFDTAGTLTAVTGAAQTYEFAGGGAPGQAVTFSFGPIAGVGTGSPTTSYARESEVSRIDQDGYEAGTLQSIGVDRQGFVTGQFSNGETLALAQLALATFPNVEGLASVGSNNLNETRRSGQPLIGQASSGSFGAIRSGNLEQSTVDLAGEFVKLIINQRAFQANTRTVSVTNELMANLVSLGQ